LIGTESILNAIRIELNLERIGDMLQHHCIYWRHNLDEQINQVFLDGVYTSKIVTEVLNDLQGDVVAFHTSPNPQNFTEFVAIWTVVCDDSIRPKKRLSKKLTFSASTDPTIAKE